MGMLPNILITGAAGAIGQEIRPAVAEIASTLRSTDMQAIEPVAGNEVCARFDLTDFDAVRHSMAGIDIVLHFGGVALEADWQTIRSANIDGTYNVFEAARQAGVRRVVYASSNHVVGFARRADGAGPATAMRPDSRYGVSKVFGEAVGRLYADKHGLEVICLRIGQFRPKPVNLRMLSLWLSPRDMAQLAKCSVEAEVDRFLVVYGVSANTRGWYDNPGAERIGYRPVDNAEDFVSAIGPDGMREDPVEAEFQGGPFCADEFDSILENVE